MLSAFPHAYAPYMQLADEAVCIGEAPSSESYLNIPTIISAAISRNADAIHPVSLAAVFRRCLLCCSPAAAAAAAARAATAAGCRLAMLPAPHACQPCGPLLAMSWPRRWWQR